MSKCFKHPHTMLIFKESVLKSEVMILEHSLYIVILLLFAENKKALVFYWTMNTIKC